MAVSGKTASPFEIPYLEESDIPDMGAGDQAIAERLHELLGEIGLSQLTEVVKELLVPTGVILATARSSAPSGFLVCDGGSVSRSTYKALFEAIGSAYGAGNGSTTFNLPDLRGRVPVGVDGAAGRLSANDALGNSAGEQTHTLTEAEMPAHSHPYDYVLLTPGIESGLPRPALANTQPSTYNTRSTGGGGAHNNMQPYQIVNYIIKI